MGRPGKKKIMKIQLDSHYHLFIYFFLKPIKVTIWHTFLECYTQKFFYKNANKLCRQQTIFRFWQLCIHPRENLIASSQ